MNMRRLMEALVNPEFDEEAESMPLDLDQYEWLAIHPDPRKEHTAVQVTDVKDPIQFGDRWRTSASQAVLDDWDNIPPWFHDENDGPEANLREEFGHIITSVVKMNFDQYMQMLEKWIDR